MFHTSMYQEAKAYLERWSGYGGDWVIEVVEL